LVDVNFHIDRMHRRLWRHFWNWKFLQKWVFSTWRNWIWTLSINLKKWNWKKWLHQALQNFINFQKLSSKKYLLSYW
jgi:hypothetical protein